MFALIIAVDEYKHPEVPNLSGCVADGDDVIEFLTTAVGVPRHQIRELRNEQATKEAIQQAIAQLAFDNHIHENDPILIYYAGHGAEVIAPIGWPSPDGKIQMLIPYDFVPEDSDEGHRMGGVLDLVLSHLLTFVSKKKGKNITVILDSCHSGSGTRREQDDPELSIRGVALPRSYYIPLDVIQGALADIRKLTGTRAIAIATGREHDGLHSHVLLSACSEAQTAKEKLGRGAFTSTLLVKLRDVGYKNITYQDIITQLPPLLNQDPQCEGVDNHRAIFSAPLSGSGHQGFETTINPAGIYTMEAGLSSGISTHAQFHIYANKTMTGGPLGIVEATIVAPFKTKLELAKDSPPFNFPDPGYAIQCQAGDEAGIRLLLDLNTDLVDMVTQAVSNARKKHPEQRGVFLVDSQDEKPDLIVTANGSFARFKIMDKECREHGLTEIPYFEVKLDAISLYPILLAAAEFYWRLKLRPKSTRAEPLVDVECFELEEREGYDEFFSPILGPNESKGNLNQDSTIHMKSNDKVKYGFRITNKCDQPLFFTMLSFDMSDMSITSFCSPIVSKDEKGGAVDPESSITVGYGAGGQPPFRSFCRDNQTTDVGFLKVFVTTLYVDYSSFVQDSPFKPEGRRGLRLGDARDAAMSLWDTVILTTTHKIEVP